MSRPLPRIVIGVPARDEEELLPACVHSVDRSVRHARSHGLVAEVAVVVGAHRCLDTTATAARTALRRLSAATDVLREDEAACVGTVRDRVARRGLALVGDGAGPTWLLSTDADTVVGQDWISQVLAVAAEHDSACVAGLVRLDAWQGSPAGMRAYRRVLDRQLPRGASGDDHRHVYGANLAVRADAYLAVGGYPDALHGEDQQLVDALDAAGYPIARTCRTTVTTSGRTHGRAAGGLADLLRRLDSGRTTECLCGLDSQDSQDAANVRI
jgi:hypothetical protein